MNFFSGPTMMISLGVCRRALAGVRSMQTKAIARTFKTPEEALVFFDEHVNLPVTQLEPILAQLAYFKPSSEVFNDERFKQLIMQASSDMDSCDSGTMARFASALSLLSLPKGGSDEISQLARKIAEVSCKRINAFSPKTLSALAYGLGSRGVSDPQFIEFVRIEALKLVQDMTPENAILLLESFRRMNTFDRVLVDNLAERLTDEVERFTARDVVNCIGVFSKLSLGRGFLLRRLHKISFNNLSMFSESQLVKLFGGFARLRFMSSAGVDKMLSEIDSRGLSKFSPNQCAEILFATAMSDYNGSSPVVGKLAQQVGESYTLLSLTALVDSVWATLLMNWDNKEILSEMIRKVYAINPPPSNRVILLKMLEVTTSVLKEFPELKIAKETIPTQWLSAMDDADKMEVGRFEAARLHTEVLSLVESIKPDGKWIKDKITLQRGNKVATGYRCDFVDESKKIVIDIDTLARPTTLALKHRHLLSDGFAVVGINYWEIRRFKNFEEQQVFLEKEIKRAVKTQQQQL